MISFLFVILCMFLYVVGISVNYEMWAKKWGKANLIQTDPPVDFFACIFWLPFLILYLPIKFGLFLGKDVKYHLVPFLTLLFLIIGGFFVTYTTACHHLHELLQCQCSECMENK